MIDLAENRACAARLGFTRTQSRGRRHGRRSTHSLCTGSVRSEEGPLPADWEKDVELGLPTKKKDVHIRLDATVLDWFRAHGPGYQTRINSVLRAFVQSRERTEQDEPKVR